MSQTIILASKSPRRKEILEDLGFRLIIKVSGIDETSDSHCETVEEEILSIARKKANAVAEQVKKECSDEVVLAADTGVVLENRILGKPKSRREAENMLRALSGKKHRVITATVIVDCKTRQRYNTTESTAVYFKDLSEPQIHYYLDSNEYLDKAGAYGIQSNGEQLVEKIEGDFFNVMGLSIQGIADFFNKYRDIEIDTVKLRQKHPHSVTKFKSDGEWNE